MIPKKIMQTSRVAIPEYVQEKIKSYITPEYDYQTFTDQDILEYFEKNKSDQFPNIINLFNSFYYSCHKADLFRYFYLWNEGGVYIDSDAMFDMPVDDIIKNYEFVGVETQHSPSKKLIFNGFIASIPKHFIIEQALIHIYNIDVDQIENDYHCFCRELHHLIYGGQWDKDPSVKIYQEKKVARDVMKSYDPLTDEIAVYHYAMAKIIPRGNIKKIPKILMQKTSVSVPEYVQKQMRHWIGDEYEHVIFDDDAACQYFRDYPLKDFPNAEERYNNIHKQSGQHSADFFRYYWIWINGGVCLDTDIMLCCPIEEIVSGDYSFIGVQGAIPNSILNGVFAVTPRHPIIYEALKHAYEVDLEDLKNNYSTFVFQFNSIVKNHQDTHKIKLYQERSHPTQDGVWETFDEHGVILYHYQTYKIIPE